MHFLCRQIRERQLRPKRRAASCCLSPSNRAWFGPGRAHRPPIIRPLQPQFILTTKSPGRHFSLLYPSKVGQTAECLAPSTTGTGEKVGYQGKSGNRPDTDPCLNSALSFYSQFLHLMLKCQRQLPDLEGPSAHRHANGWYASCIHFTCARSVALKRWRTAPRPKVHSWTLFRQAALYAIELYPRAAGARRPRRSRRGRTSAMKYGISFR